MNCIRIESELNYSVISPTSFVFNISGAVTQHQKIVDEKLIVSPKLNIEWCHLNEQGARGIRLNALPGDLKIHYAAKIELSPEIEQPGRLDEVSYRSIPTDAMQFLNPSRYCESDRLGRFAWKEFGHLEGGYFRVLAICDWVFNHIDYVAGSTDASTSACDVLIQRAGVCRDFAHLGIALCRALGIPARYVAGYAVGLKPQDFHGFFEAYLNDAWYLFDATKMAPVSGFVRIGMGRDAADASFATIVGKAVFKSMLVSAVADDLKPHNDADNAISTA